MLDALVADRVQTRPGGLQAVCGYWVLSLDCAERDAERLVAAEHPVLWTELNIVDETVVLTAFADQERRELYRALRRVSGIGRRSAVLVLDLGEALDTLRAVAASDRGYFRGIPGLGPQRIDAIVKELRRRYQTALPQALTIPVRTWVEVRDALIQAGSSFDQAEARLSQLDQPATDTERLLKQALATDA